MKLYTSYWAMVRNFPRNLIGLNTTVWPPKWRPLGKDKNGVIIIDCPPLKPGRECEGLCNGKCNPKHPDDCKFLEAYTKQLARLDIQDFYAHLANISEKIITGEQLDDIDFALIVYETPQNPCSERWPLQIWLRKNGIAVEEWHPNN